MPPEYGHLNRHFNIGKYLKRLGYNPTVFVGSYLHNTGKQMIYDKSLLNRYKNCDFQYYYIRTCDYSKNKAVRVYAMFEYYFNLLKVIKRFNKPDVIIGSSAHPLAAIAAIRLAKRYGCQSIVEIRDLWPESFVAYNIIKKNNPILKLLYAGEKWIYKKADKLIFTMEGGKDYIIEKGWAKEHGGPIDINKVYHINNGVDLEVFDYNKEHYVLEDEDLTEDGTFKVVYAGSIRLVNKVEKILDVAKLLRSQNVKFLIWGDGDQLDPLRKRVEEEQINNVCFKGRVEKKYVPYITSKAQLNIILGDNLPLYRYGSSANKLFDYFASGRPTLNTKTYRYSLINRYRAGLELEDSSAERVAESIMYFKNLNKSDYEEYCKNARKAAQDYSFKNLTIKLIDIIDS
jgi:glycosyltransferase involved in cell wall biosynthesis